MIGCITLRADARLIFATSEHPTGRYSSRAVSSGDGQNWIPGIPVPVIEARSVLRPTPRPAARGWGSVDTTEGWRFCGVHGHHNLFHRGGSHGYPRNILQCCPVIVARMVLKMLGIMEDGDSLFLLASIRLDVRALASGITMLAMVLGASTTTADRGWLPNRGWPAPKSLKRA